MTIPALLPLSTNDASEGEVGPARPAGLRCERGPLPLRAVDVHAKIVGLSAEVLVTQIFGNDFDGPIEATYTFPLPDRAAVNECRVSLGGRRLRAVLRERGEAREGYARAVAAGRRAALAEEDRPDVFTTTLGNLGPGEQAEVRLSLVVPLDARDGEATFRFPLVVAPRYVPGAPLGEPPAGPGVVGDTDRVPDASRVSPPRLAPGGPSPVRLSLTIDLEAPGRELGELRSSLHRLDVEARPWGYRLTLPPGERLDRDVVVRFRERRPGTPARLLVQRDRAGDGATFALTIDPEPAGGASPPRDVVFVLDRSGSMEGWKMTSARRAAMTMIDALGERDRFAVIAFDDRAESPQGGPNGLALAPATFRHRSEALAFLERLGARGGTEMGGPLLEAARLLQADASRRRAVVLVTDGQVSQEDEILGPLGRSAGRVPVAAVGIDSAVNAGFLQRLAALTGGFCELVESEARLEAVLEALHARLSAPTLTDLDLEFDGASLDPESLTPRRLGAVFPGVPLRVQGRFRRASDAAAVRVRARDAGGAAWSTSAPASFTDNRALHPLWARARLRDLEDRYLVDRHLQAELERAIVKTSLEAGVLSRFTAFLVVDEERARAPGEPLRSVAQPVETPAGWAEHRELRHEILSTDSLFRFPEADDSDDEVQTLVLASRLASPAAPPPPAAPRRPRPGEGQAQTRAGVIRGKIVNLAPEQARGGPTDARTDVYALGLLLYELVGGQSPFRGGSDFETLEAILTRPAPPLAVAHAPLAALVARALERDPEDRFDDAAAFGAALDRLLVEGAAPGPADFEAFLEGLVPGARARSADLLARASADAAGGPPGRLRPIAELGTGSLASTWLALRRDEQGRATALVVRALHEAYGEGSELRELFLDEASLEHPNVVRVLEAGETSEGLAYLATEYVDGVTLDAILRALRRQGGGLGASPIAVAIVRQVAEALAFAHALRDGSGKPLGWYHGRLRPEYVLVGFDGVVKVKGFGPAPAPEFSPQRSKTPLPLVLERPPAGPPPSPQPPAPRGDHRPPVPASEPKVVIAEHASGPHASAARPGGRPPAPKGALASGGPDAAAPELPPAAPAGFFQTLRRKFWGGHSP
ncbi:MAG TPA: VIT domain-containing protein [Polyangiaceae bacterium]|nr:VIT domain-containing protein [Polyangiaceae bacterium]